MKQNPWNENIYTKVDLSCIMGQHDVYQFLKNNPDRWLTKEEISEGINSHLRNVTKALSKMTRSDEVLERTKIKFNNYQVERFYMFKK